LRLIDDRDFTIRGSSPNPRPNGERESDAFGGSRPLPELFAAAGYKFQFDVSTIKALIQLASKELKKV